VADRIITFAELVGKKMSSPAMHQKMYPDGIAAEIDLYHGPTSTHPTS
jgi:hypothetical protein